MENKSIGSYNSLKLDYYHPDDKYHFMFTQIPDFLFEDPVCQKLSNNAKLLFGKMLRETRLAAKKGNIDTDEIIAWSKDKYNLLINDSKKSYVSNCAKAIIDAISIATDKEDFITL
ncbi:MAG: replication initiator protein A, partial [Lachnospiraceae bacterium]|nr:replication initiator protein A [Lachnospiraceae bacterium]